MSPARTGRLRRSVWLPNLATFVLLAVVIGLAYLVQSLFPPRFDRDFLLAAGLIMSLVPAALWIAFFYRMDANEPEPKGMIVRVFLLGALLASGLGLPLISLFNLPDWLYAAPWVTLLGAVLVLGFTQEFLKYAAVRFSVYRLPEFSERTDGIIYAVAAGLGYATVLNVEFMLDSGGGNLGLAAARIVLTALAQASFAGVTGYFLGRQRFEARPLWWMPLGLTISALLNGLFFYLWGTLKRSSGGMIGGNLNPWIGLGLAAALAALTAFCLAWLIQRDQRRFAPEEV